jgi:hypothetical protein
MAESHVVSALVAKRAELAGQIQALDKQVAQLRADLVHVDAVLRMFAPTADPAAIPAKRPYRRRRWFKNGELPRRILDTLRGSEMPLSAAEIAGRVMVAKGLDADDADTLLLIRKSVQSYLRRQNGALVQQSGSNGQGLWRVT